MPSTPEIEVMFTTLRMTRRPSAVSRLAASRRKLEAARRIAERSHQMNVQHGLKLLVGHLLNDVVPDVAGVVDDDVEGAEGGDGGIHQLLRKVGRGEIAGQPARALASLRGSFLERASSISVSITDAPHAASLRATARPIPRPDPVTSAALPSSVNGACDALLHKLL